MYEGYIHNFITSTAKFSQSVRSQLGAIQKFWGHTIATQP